MVHYKFKFEVRAKTETPVARDYFLFNKNEAALYGNGCWTGIQTSFLFDFKESKPWISLRRNF